MTIVDGFIFFNELDVLKIRLKELYPVIDKFVLVESNVTFRGDPKPLYFDNHYKEFAKYEDKIHVVRSIDPVPGHGGKGQVPWLREAYQRNMIGMGFKDCSPEDIVMVSDVDEIPRRSAIEKLDPKKIQSINMDMFYYGLNVYGGKWGAMKAVRFKNFTSAQEIREAQADHWVDNAGWHFSYLGTPKAIAQKLQSFSHWELDTPDTTNEKNILRRMQNLEDIWGHGEKYARVEVDDSYPELVKAEPAYFNKYLW